MTDYIRKPEKLASALYLVTSFFSDQEPIKWKLRTLASEFVSLGVLIDSNVEPTISKTRNIVLEITSLLAVARNAGMISPANFDLMDGEFHKYVNALSLPSNISDILRIEVPAPKAKEIAPNPIAVPIASPIVSPIVSPIASPVVPIVKDKVVAEMPVESHLLESFEVEKPLKEFGAVLVKKNSRQNVIISILKRKKEIMIKDVTPLINGCSEKTIQRELLSMVHTGVLKKIGEKRWSRYTLA